MRLLVIVNTGVWGGAERFLWLLCGELLHRGVPTVAVCPTDGPVAERFRELPLTACYEEELGVAAGWCRGMGSFALYAPGARGKFADILSRVKAEHGCDVVLCQYPREQILSVDVAPGLDYRTIWMIHSRLYYMLHRAILNPTLRRAMLRANAVFVFSNNTRRAFVADGFPEFSMKVLPEAIDVPAAVAPRQSKQPCIGVVSRLNHNKGIQDVLRAMPSLLNEFPKLQLLIAGDGRYRSSLEKLAHRLKIESSVRFLGFQRDPWQVLSQLDVLVHPTFDPGDSMPLALLEAGAAALPVVTTDWGGIPEIVQDQRSGLLVPAHDVQALGSAIKRLVRDKTLADKMGRDARDWVKQNFSIPAVTDRFLDALASHTKHINAEGITASNASC